MEPGNRQANINSSEGAQEHSVDDESLMAAHTIGIGRWDEHKLQLAVNPGQRASGRTSCAIDPMSLEHASGDDMFSIHDVITNYLENIFALQGLNCHTYSNSSAMYACYAGTKGQWLHVSSLQTKIPQIT